MSVAEEIEKSELAPFKDAPIGAAQGIASIALTMAMKYHSISTIQDGTLYQQYKLEGRNIREIDINDVFETAKQIEAHLLAASDRVAAMIIDALQAPVEGE